MLAVGALVCRVALELLELFGGERAGDVDIAFLQQEELGAGVGAMEDQQPFDRRRLGVVRVCVERHALAGAPRTERERPRARAVLLQPRIAEIIVGSRGR